MAFDPDHFLATESAVATTFADPDDIRRFKAAKQVGMTDLEAFNYGDNGEGFWGDDTTADEPMVALPRDLAGVAHNRRVELTGPDGRQVIARIADVMPKQENIENGAGIDVNPAAAKALGNKGRQRVRWRYLDDDPAAAPAAFDPDEFLAEKAQPVTPADKAVAGSFDPDAFLGNAHLGGTTPPESETSAHVGETIAAPDETNLQPAATPAAQPIPINAPVASPAGTPASSLTVPPAAGPTPAAAEKPESEMWWWERAARGAGGGFLDAYGTLLKSPLGAAVAPGDPGYKVNATGLPPTHAERAAELAHDAELRTRLAGELQTTGKALTATAPESFARGVGETVGAIAPYIAGDVTGGPVAMLPMLFASGFQEHMDGAAAKGQDGTVAGLAGGALNLALGLPIFKTVKGVARAIVPDAAGMVQRTVREVYAKMGIPGVERLVAALSAATKAGERWTEGHAKALGLALKSLDKEIRSPVTAALRKVILNAGESAAIGGTVTTGHNLIAQSYDPDRPTLQGVPEALATFGAIGAIGATGAAVGKVRSAIEAREYLRQKFQERPVDAATVTPDPTLELPGSQEPPASAAPAAGGGSSTPGQSASAPPPAATAAQEPPPAQSQAPIPPGPAVPRPSVQTPPPEATEFPQLGNDPDIRVAGSDVVQVPTSHIALRPELMQFKAIDDRATGTNAEDKITAPYDPVKADNLLLWEPIDPAQYGLKAPERYIAADGHHRHTAAVEQNVGKQNVQILRESAGFSANDARTIAAEKNIAGGKGTIFDQAKFIRNVAATHGPDAAMERAGFIGARGRKAATIALAAEPDLFASFINEQITPDAAAAIANVAPHDAGLQRLGITRALQGDEPDLIQNFLQAVRATMGPKAPSAEQFDLFAADDQAMKAAEKAARRARAIQKEIGEQINSVLGASKRPEKARELGVNVEDPAAVQLKLVELQALRDRARNWALDDAIRDQAMKGEGTAADAVKRLQTSTATATSAAPAEFNPDEFLQGEEAAPMSDRDREVMKSALQRAINEGRPINALNAEEAGIALPEGWVETLDKSIGDPIRIWQPAPAASAEGPQPNKHGVYEEGLAELITFNLKGPKNAPYGVRIRLLQLPDGWIMSTDWSLSNSGRSSPLSHNYAPRFPTREGALRGALEQMRFELTRNDERSDTSAADKERIEKILQWNTEQLSQLPAAGEDAGGAGRGSIEPPPPLGFEIGAGPADPADNPTFTAFPIDLPEAVRFGTEILGATIKVMRKMKLGAQYAGEFMNSGEIHLRADIADLLTDRDKAELVDQAQDYAERTANPGDSAAKIAQVARARYEFLLDQAYQEAKRKPPVQALRVLWHEIGHAISWLPDRTLNRGNLFGHLAALKNHLQGVFPIDPTKPAGQAISPKDRARLMKEAEKQLRHEMGPIAEIVETIMVEEPILRIVGITPADIKALFGIDAREAMPELYKWFAEQSAEVKKEIVRKAMRDVLDERLAKLGKTEQVGVTRTQKTVRKKVGREPTIEEVRERFQKLFRDELQRRNLAHLRILQMELRSTIAWWRGTDVIPPYFDNAVEMYAEAFSIFMNNPAALQKRAPTYAQLLWNYMDARPAVAAIYRQIQNQIKAGQVADETEKAMLDSWDKADEQGLELSKRPPTTARDFLDNVSYHIDRRMGPIYRAAAGTPREDAVRLAIGNFLYRASEHELFLTRMNTVVSKPLVAANLDWSDLGRFLFYERVTNERFKIFNPYGVAPNRALERLEKMEKSLGPQRWQVLQDAAADFRSLYQLHVVAPMKEARLWNDELQAAIDANVYYATFDVRRDLPGDGISRMLEQSLGGNVGPHIYRQIGTVQEIKNPATATVLKSLSLISAAARNIAKRETVQMLLQSDPSNILEARKRWTGDRWEIVPVENNQVGTVVYLEEGKPLAFYVRKVVADALNKGNSIDNRLVLAAVRATSMLKGLFTQLNYAFWPVNFVRDTFGWILQMPGASTRLWMESARGMLAESHRSLKGRPNQYAELALQRRMLISRADPQGIWSAVDNEFELKLASYGLEPAQWAKQADRVHTLVKLWNSYREIGQSFERVNKLAGMIYLDKYHPDMPEWKKREIVRERAGSPDFLQRGASNPYIDFLMMFYNPWKEGIRSVYRAARENPWSFAAKALAFIVAPVVMQALAASGIFGEEKRKQYRSIPDYDLSNYLCIPLGWQDQEQGKIAYLRLPLWEPARIAHGTIWQFITGRGQGLASFYGGTVPSMNAMLNVAKDWMDYEVFGHNPYDEHRGKLLLDETTFQAGGWPARQELLKQTWNNLGGSIAFRFQNKQLESAPEGEVEKFLRLPIVNNAVNRWVKVSNRGLDDADRQLTQPMQEMHAQIRLAVHEINRKLLAGEGLVESEKRILREPYALEYLQRTLPPAAAAQQSNLMRRLQGKSTQEKALILGAAGK